MDFNPSNGGGGSAPATAKFLIAGGFGVGKTTFVGAISEIRPLRTEEPLSVASVGIDDTRAVGGKTTTTVAMDFGRISVHSGLVLYLFGTPGQERFWFMWDELAVGALGAVVLADTRRVADCFASIDYFERNGTPFVIAVNCFDGAPRFQPEDIRIALTLGPEVPILLCDARQRESVKQVLVSLVKHVMAVTGPALSGGLRLLPVRTPGLRGEDRVTARARGVVVTRDRPPPGHATNRASSLPAIEETRAGGAAHNWAVAASWTAMWPPRLVARRPWASSRLAALLRSASYASW